ncbi:MAG: hypothetical protein IKK17_05170, partial [Oscillospiraceae bacterium]|nr:hypothetical protein [Oscillospiraceae bacterium]
LSVARSCAVGWNSGRMLSAPTREEDFGAAVESGGSKRPPYGKKTSPWPKGHGDVLHMIQISKMIRSFLLCNLSALASSGTSP